MSPVFIARLTSARQCSTNQTSGFPLEALRFIISIIQTNAARQLVFKQHSQINNTKNFHRKDKNKSALIIHALERLNKSYECILY